MYLSIKMNYGHFDINILIDAFAYKVTHIKCNLTYQWPVYAFTKGKLYGKFAHILMLSCKNKLFFDEYRASNDCNYGLLGFRFATVSQWLITGSLISFSNNDRALLLKYWFSVHNISCYNINYTDIICPPSLCLICIYIHNNPVAVTRLNITQCLSLSR